MADKRVRWSNTGSQSRRDEVRSTQSCAIFTTVVLHLESSEPFHGRGFIHRAIVRRCSGTVE